MNILHSTTDPSLLQRLKEMLSSSARADMAVGYFFVISGFTDWFWQLRERSDLWTA